MPCYVNIIIRVRLVRRMEKQDSKLLVVWAVDVYSIKCEDNKIEMVLFVLLEFHKRDFETQAIFKKDNFTVSVERLYLHIMRRINDLRFYLMVLILFRSLFILYIFMNCI